MHDLEVLYGNEILDNSHDIEYCINTVESPLVVYVPKDIDYAEFKYQAKFCQDKIVELKRHSLSNVETKMGRYLDLQLELQLIQHGIIRSVPQDIANAITFQLMDSVNTDGRGRKDSSKSKSKNGNSRADRQRRYEQMLRDSNPKAAKKHYSSQAKNTQLANSGFV